MIYLLIAAESAAIILLIGALLVGQPAAVSAMRTEIVAQSTQIAVLRAIPTPTLPRRTP